MSMNFPVPIIGGTLIVIGSGGIPGRGITLSFSWDPCSTSTCLESWQSRYFTSTLVTLTSLMSLSSFRESLFWWLPTKNSFEYYVSKEHLLTLGRIRYSGVMLICTADGHFDKTKYLLFSVHEFHALLVSLKQTQNVYNTLHSGILYIVIV